MKKYPHGDTSWFVHDRFGMFIHWGLYSLPARHEWIQSKECIPGEEYRKYFDHFNPALFNPKEWAAAARAAGMKYFVITAKHHEGFCMWDTKYTDYKVTNTRCGRDLLREVTDAFRAEGIRVGYYYSLLDWHHPDFILDNRTGPYWNAPDEVRKALNKGRNMHRYAKYMRDQVTELLTNYGKIDVMWFDFSYPSRDGKHNPETGKDHLDWESEKLLKTVRSLQPDIVIDNRLDLPGAGDILTPEQYTPDACMKDENGREAVWEGCQTFSGSWGYFRDETSWKSPDQCIELLLNHVSRGGNLLMNVGPTARGFMDYRACDRLKVFADWMKYNSEAIYGCGAAPANYPAPQDCRFTYNKKEKKLYISMFALPYHHLVVENIADKIEYAQILADNSEIKYRFCTADHADAGNNMNPNVVKDNAVMFMIPPGFVPFTRVPVIEIFLKKEL